MGALYNKFSELPYIPYRIAAKLMENEDIFKILKYPTYDCLSKPNLSFKQKQSMIWKNQDNQEDYNIFLSPRIENMIIDARTILKIYRYEDTPVDNLKDTISYEFDLICGDKIAMIDYNGVPCHRIDVLEMLILKTLNGSEIAGLIGPLQYNRQMSRDCKSIMGLNISNKFIGTSLMLVSQMSCLEDACGL